MQQKVITAFKDHFNYAPKYIVQAPGRVNLMGEHTDYNNGFVLPIAIDRYIWLAFSPRTDDQVHVYAMNFEQQQQFDINNLQRGQGWQEYIKGMAWILQQSKTNLGGFDAVLYGNIPRGAGLSSSAALELAAGYAFTTTVNVIEMAKLAQQAENKWVGMNCGIMDQMIIATAKSDHALLLDCRDLTAKHIPLPQDVAIVVMDTATRRELVTGNYNERRQQCEAAAKKLKVTSLREVTPEIWHKAEDLLTSKELLRVQHVLTENERVLQAAEAMQQYQTDLLGELMNSSHISMRDNFEISSYNLDTMVDIAQGAVGCFGARMTGGGFAGCAVALVKEIYADEFTYQVAEQYEHETKLKPTLYVTRSMGGICTKCIR